MSTIPPRRGRPPKILGGKRIDIYIDASSLETAKSLGDGNASDGIRKALTHAGKYFQLYAKKP